MSISNRDPILSLHNYSRHIVEMYDIFVKYEKENKEMIGKNKEKLGKLARKLKVSKGISSDIGH